MQDETDEKRPLILAIATMRAELDNVINTELDRLLTGHVDQDGHGATRGSIESQAPPRGLPDPGPEVLQPRRRSESWSSHSTAPTSTAPDSSRFSAGDKDDEEESGAVERRLDALALRLEDRLKRTRDREATRLRWDDETAPNPNQTSSGES